MKPHKRNGREARARRQQDAAERALANARLMKIRDDAKQAAAKAAKNKDES